MRDVADLSGTSLKTVSRVINGEENVAQDTAEKVRQAAERLGYRPNFSAGSLRRSGGKTKTIGLLLENIANPFSSSLHRAIEEIARKHEVIVLAGSLDEDPERERELTEAFVSRRVDGLIVVPAGDDQSYLQSEIDSGTALVFVDRAPTGVAADTVVSTNAKGAHEATMHLIHHGHTKIAYLGDYATIYTGAERLEGYKRALKENKIAYNPDYVLQGYHSPEEAEIALRALLNRPDRPTAIFASQNLVTIGALRALHHSNLQHRVALVGFDEIPGADLFDPPVTLVAQDVLAMGEAAANLLFSRLNGDTSAPKHVEIPTTLNLRGSGEIPAK